MMMIVFHYYSTLVTVLWLPHGVSIVKTEQSLVILVVEGQIVFDAVGPALCRFNQLYIEPDKTEALFVDHYCLTVQF